MITLSNVNDAYSVSLTPNSCVIKADYDGSNPTLTNAYTDISVYRGDVPHECSMIIKDATEGTEYLLTKINPYIYRLQLTALSPALLSGEVVLTVQTDDEFVADVHFQYSVVRETSMLDWILDWEGNKTTIGDSYLITPKIFVGKKVTTEEDLSALTGVYIGPDDIDGNGPGIYGYKEGVDVFHINSNGAMIGGWIINEEGLFSETEKMKILSNGSIQCKNEADDMVWSLSPDGSGYFGMGAISWDHLGNAKFAGRLEAGSGLIGGWTIDEGRLYSNHALLTGTPGYFGVDGGTMMIAIDPITNQPIEEVLPNTAEGHITKIKRVGGVYMTFISRSDYGIRGYLANELNASIYGDPEPDERLAFSLGSQNQIGPWKFDDSAIWYGAKVNMAQQYTRYSGDITIGSQGMRGYGWYIDNTGDISFLNGKVKFTHDAGDIVGWNINANRLSTNNVAIVSTDTEAGIYMSVNESCDFNTRSSSSLTDYIDSWGGMYWKIKSDGVSFAAYDSEGYKIFKLRSNGVSSIAEWNISHNTLYTGTETTSGFTATGEITLGPTGLRGFKWRFENDGSGALAGGNISWDKDGNVTFAESVTLAWGQCVDSDGNAVSGYLTKIGSDGIYTGTISADNITAGTIKACSIQNSAENPTWYLNTDGSGALANGAISWSADGKTVEFTGKITANSGSIGGFSIGSGRIGSETTANNDYGGSLAIYDNFFRVGGSKGYVMFGNDVIPAVAGGAFTAVGRIVNSAPNTYGGYGFDQANYGLFIDVTGGTKNYGIHSNAALMAPSFITTKCKCLTFTGSSYSIDFSQHNVILMFYWEADYSGVTVTLPTESSVADKFGMSSLPNDFATVVLFKVRQNSKNITLKNIYNSNEQLQDYVLGPGDSIMVLISKVDGFRYQIINHIA